MVAHSKVLLAGIISGIVAITTGFLGVTGTVIGSVIASVIYNFLSESLEKRIDNADISKFESELIYLLPLIVIALIQLILILAFLAEGGYVGSNFLHAYLYLQDLVSNNLYRILGFSTLFISVYPIFLKTKKLNIYDSIALAGAGIIFLLKGFIDLKTPIVGLYRDAYLQIDFYLAIIAFLILAYLIIKLSYNAYYSNKKISKEDLEDLKLKNNPKKITRDVDKINDDYQKMNSPKKKTQINAPAEDIEFVSNDMFKDKKKK
ncbi:hypothetical protein [Methanobrevibacter sp. DSM 116169]|uniref:hypothetical protein n=1 Tax=Methanobrevibacter sp. DSM 116169 TaxID=3242727 RepID=UPI0038FD3E67